MHGWMFCQNRVDRRAELADSFPVDDPQLTNAAVGAQFDVV